MRSKAETSANVMGHMFAASFEAFCIKIFGKRSQSILKRPGKFVKFFVMGSSLLARLLGKRPANGGRSVHRSKLPGARSLPGAADRD